MQEDTGEVRPYDEIPPSERNKWSEPFGHDDHVNIKGGYFKIKSWKRGELRLKFVRSKSNNRPSFKDGEEVRVKGLTFIPRWKGDFLILQHQPWEGRNE